MRVVCYVTYDAWYAAGCAMHARMRVRRKEMVCGVLAAVCGMKYVVCCVRVFVVRNVWCVVRFVQCMVCNFCVRGL